MLLNKMAATSGYLRIFVEWARRLFENSDQREGEAG
jgi:hypothetical protein